ncbi:hypothetical protein P171DRAFT_166290 [Karstenula rhodostoma CBS 690.94]|uniref:Uncharacterized protein n=1 Tax=Karstenula rhodostoma CBS 690.94 TaxID=1392251 RepID=A0A9P4P717_9PLEO|nr:hypothetical protein P171DRAFT_166290 [Karstenula rhodostoma CBS 690.94]
MRHRQISRSNDSHVGTVRFRDASQLPHLAAHLPLTGVRLAKIPREVSVWLPILCSIGCKSVVTITRNEGDRMKCSVSVHYWQRSSQRGKSLAWSGHARETIIIPSWQTSPQRTGRCAMVCGKYQGRNLGDTISSLGKTVPLRPGESVCFLPGPFE